MGVCRCGDDGDSPVVVPFSQTAVRSTVENMDERVTLEGFDPPKNRRHGPDGDLVDVQGWLHAPVDWQGGPQLERAWRDRHGRSRLGIGLCVANNPRRHFILINVPDDLDFLRVELESLIDEVESSDIEDTLESA